MLQNPSRTIDARGDPNLDGDNQGQSQDVELGRVELKKKKIETLNKHSFNKPSTKKNTQNYCFLRYYNAVIYENGTRRLFKSSKLPMIESILIVATMSLSMNNIIASDKNSSSILL